MLCASLALTSFCRFCLKETVSLWTWPRFTSTKHTLNTPIVFFFFLSILLFFSMCVALRSTGYTTCCVSSCWMFVCKSWSALWSRCLIKILLVICLLRTVDVSVFSPFLLVALVGYYLLLWHFVWMFVFDVPQTWNQNENSCCRWLYRIHLE